MSKTSEELADQPHAPNMLKDGQWCGPSNTRIVQELNSTDKYLYIYLTGQRETMTGQNV